MRAPGKSSPNAPDFQIPDLELDSVPSAKPRPLVERRPSGAQQIQVPNLTPREIEGSDEPDTGGALELDQNSGTHRASSPSELAQPYFGAALGDVSLGGAFELDDEPMQLEAIATEVNTAPWPRGRHDASRLEVTRAEVESLADYGNSQVPFVMAPAYALRVLTRQHQLKRELLQLQQELLDREADRDQLLVDMVSEQRQQLETSGKFVTMLSALDAAERQLLVQQEALAKVNQSLSSELNRADDELGKLDGLRAQHQASVAEQQQVQTTLAHDFKRQEAQLKRVQIEVRNIKLKAREALGPAGGAIPEALRTELEPLLKREQALTPQVTAAREELAQAVRELERREQLVKGASRQMDAIRAQKRASIKKHQQKLASESHGLQHAEDRHVEEARRLAHAVLDLKGTIPVPRETLDRIGRADDAVAQAYLDAERHARALDSYDRDTYRLGLKLAALPLVALMAFVMLRLLF